MEALHGNTLKDVSCDLTAFNDTQLLKLLRQWVRQHPRSIVSSTY